MNKLYLYVIGGLAAVYFISKISMGKKLNFSLRNIKTGGKILKPTVTLEIAAQNPTNSGAILKSLSGSLYINKQYVANFSSFGDQNITPNSESIINIEARPSLLAAFRILKDFIKNKPGNVTANFSGVANVDGFSLPVNENFTL